MARGDNQRRQGSPSPSPSPAPVPSSAASHSSSSGGYGGRRRDVTNGQLGRSNSGSRSAWATSPAERSGDRSSNSSSWRRPPPPPPDVQSQASATGGQDPPAAVVGGGGWSSRQSQSSCHPSGGSNGRAWARRAAADVQAEASSSPAGLPAQQAPVGGGGGGGGVGGGVGGGHQRQSRPPNHRRSQSSSWASRSRSAERNSDPNTPHQTLRNPSSNPRSSSIRRSFSGYPSLGGSQEAQEDGEQHGRDDSRERTGQQQRRQNPSPAPVLPSWNPPVSRSAGKSGDVIDSASLSSSGRDSSSSAESGDDGRIGDEEANATNGGGEGGGGGGGGRGKKKRGRKLVDTAGIEHAIFQGYRQRQLTPTLSRRWADVDDEEDEEEEEEEGEEVIQEFASGSLEKIRDYLIASQSGATSCLICLGKIRVSDSVWDCKKGCYCIFHLQCIQTWARQSSAASAARAVANASAGLVAESEAPSAPATTVSWHCPKCRSEFSQSEIPREYRCFCGKERDPPVSGWIAPHSCGERCELPLRSTCSSSSLAVECGHQCSLLCHPGPCPPCPQLLLFRCYCGARAELKRCGHRQWSCRGRCSKPLECGIHLCQSECHPGECPPCSQAGEYTCRCGGVSESRTCAERDFQCEKLCGKRLPCGRHTCDAVCHPPGKCPGCPLSSGKRVCPCGKVEFKDLTCDVPTPTCGATCEKLLPCGRHRCPERCHVGPCIDLCRAVVSKQCRCGGQWRDVPCHQEFHCDRKCMRARNCVRHPCKRRCCDGNCPPCADVCGRKLMCGNHKCQAPCHRGPCAPCMVTVRVACACGATAFNVPCGAEKDQKPPRCRKMCAIQPLCRHQDKLKPHRCHYGPCPPCGLRCEEKLPCSHLCQQICHGPRPPPNPDYTWRPKSKKQLARELEMSKRVLKEGDPCPPCSELVIVTCLGQHQARLMPCVTAASHQCQELCGNPLPCGHHTCQKLCHVVTVMRGPRPLPASVVAGAVTGGQRCTLPEGDVDVSSKQVQDSCESCIRPCEQERQGPPCPHPCGRLCHPEPCAPCAVPLKKLCHCGMRIMILACHLFKTATEVQLRSLLCCGDFCHKRLPFCSHLCPELCHPGPCPKATECHKKVTVRCACRRLKKEMVCSDAQAAVKGDQKTLAGQGGLGKEAGTGDGNLIIVASGITLLDCDEECKRLLKEKEEMEAEAELRRRKARALEEDSLANLVGAGAGQRRRKGRGRGGQTSGSSSARLWQTVLSLGLVRKATRVILILLILLLIYSLFLCLSWLSDLMNERDKVTPRKRPPGYHFFS
ncbi:hypothetical protein CBR_g3071 [Chara braunii]|uniref:NF-X1-type domain-containing protein n=1 Tax=Chara braunii TaxID=69332 RepID=A0A388KEU5_CHABU|nr:hypothetical protein CBR_g3071 [Chara braunii]|eukprot:GBG68527.1 hypothetical protein CBR_g3071 [Chara braunii]